ncbi:uncharacterized protein BDR25DRAFT_201786, partial [Lindgomyces ingoldianus]
RTPISWAAEKGQLRCLKLLIAHDTDKNVLNNCLQTRLFRAAYSRHNKVVKYLPSRRVDTRRRDATGKT